MSAVDAKSEGVFGQCPNRETQCAHDLNQSILAKGVIKGLSSLFGHVIASNIL